MSCPKCGSDQWKMAALVYAEGTSKSESLSLGGGGAVGDDDVTPVFGGGNTFGTQQTELAKLAAPPEAEPFRVPKLPAPITHGYHKKAVILFLIGFPGMIISESSGGVSLALVVVAVMVASIFFMLAPAFSSSAKAETKRNEEAKKQARREWEEAEKKKQADYKKTKFCLRCGEKYLPE